VAQFSTGILAHFSISIYNRTESGELFACCAPTLEACRERRDKWLDAKNKSVC
ncbi:MAG: DUF3873 family protein, partial [Phocaeicola vulgatus]